MTVQEHLSRFEAVAKDPAGQLKGHLARGRKVVLTAPVYTPEEIIYAMGLVPMGVWGGDMELRQSKEYFPAFLCSIVQSIVELGMAGAYEGAGAIVIPSLCDSLKVLGQNWKYAVPDIPFVPMTWPQNRKPDYARDFILAGYERLIRDLEAATGAVFEEERLEEAIRVYNDHDGAMRSLAKALAAHPEVGAAQRSAVFKSAWFMDKAEHTAWVTELLAALAAEPAGPAKLPIVTTGILADAPGITALLDEYGFTVAADDVAAESRQYRTDTPEGGAPLERLARKFQAMDCCSVLYDPKKQRVEHIVRLAKDSGAKAVVMLLTKFCDPEEFDAPLIKKACDAAGLPMVQIEVDRQMVNYGQARTMLETLRDTLTA